MIVLATHPGPRENLEDYALASSVQRGDGTFADLLAVTDGVGGAAYGEIASLLGASHFITALTAALTTDSLACTSQLPELVRSTLVDANRLLLTQIEAEAELVGMATTAVCAVLQGHEIIVGWVGDSRCYLLQDHELRRLTRDHSRRQELLDTGLLCPEEASDHPEAHTITRYLGQADRFEPEVATAPVSGGDIVLLCTDGLTDVLADDEIERVILAGSRTPTAFRQIPNRLVRAALEAGTTDNITVLCARCGDWPATTPEITRTITADYPLHAAQTLITQFMESTYVNAKPCTSLAC